MDVRDKYPEAARIAQLFEHLAEAQRWDDGPELSLEITGGKARVVLLNDKDASVHDLSKARSRRRDRNLRQPPVPPPSVS